MTLTADVAAAQALPAAQTAVAVLIPLVVSVVQVLPRIGSTIFGETGFAAEHLDPVVSTIHLEPVTGHVPLAGVGATEHLEVIS
jgi:hypothetical protein